MIDGAVRQGADGAQVRSRAGIAHAQAAIEVADDGPVADIAFARLVPDIASQDERQQLRPHRAPFGAAADPAQFEIAAQQHEREKRRQDECGHKHVAVEILRRFKTLAQARHEHVRRVREPGTVVVAQKAADRQRADAGEKLRHGQQSPQPRGFGVGAQHDDR